MKYREVGKTGIKISQFSIGTTRYTEDVLEESLRLGVNFYHTCTRYVKGKAIKDLAKMLKGKRDKVYLGLKDNFDSIEQALKILGTDHVEFIFFNRHMGESLRQELPEIKKQFLTWRDKGLVKYAGLTSHGDMAACLDVAMEADFFTCVMPTYTPLKVKELAKQADALRKKNISIMAMKTKGELESQAYPAQIQKVLTDPNVCTVCRGVNSLDDLKEWTGAAAAAKTGFWMRRHYNRYANNYEGCGLCGKCTEACPNNVATSDIVRCIRYYHDAEATPHVAAQEFGELACASSILDCEECGACEKACPQGIPVRREIRRAAAKWA